MFERYGEAAQDEVLRRAEDMCVSGDIAGEATWTAIGQYLTEMMKRPSWLPARPSPSDISTLPKNRLF
jgi:hypothetical protein